MDYRIEEINNFKMLVKCEKQIIGDVKIGMFWDRASSSVFYSGRWSIRFNSIAHGNPIIHATIGTIQVKELQKAMKIVFSDNISKKLKIIALEVYTYRMKLIKRYVTQRVFIF